MDINKTWGSKSKLILISWALFDWANSAFPTVITTFIFASYFTKAIAKNTIIGTQQWGNTIAVAGLIIAILSPILGAIADKAGRRKPWVGFFTALTIISSFLLYFSKPSTAYIYWTLSLIVLGTIGFEMANVFYNAMMKDLVSPKYLGRLSGIAWGMGYVGGLFCLFLILPLIQSDVHWAYNKEALPIRLSGPIVAGWLLLFSLPFFIKTPDKSNHVPFKQAIMTGCKTFLSNLRNLKHQKNLWQFLLANMLYKDGLNTIFIFGGIFAATEFGFKPQEIIILGIVLNVFSGLGAILFGWIDDYLGPKNTILFSLICLILTLSFLLMVRETSLFWILATLLSLFVGPIQAASRTLVLHITPPERLTEVFGLFSFSGKVSVFLGPWLVGLTTSAFSSIRIGMSIILIFLFCGALVLIPLKYQDTSLRK